MEPEVFAFRFAVLCLATIGCFSLPVLVAYWLSKSRLPWLFKSLTIVALACPLVVVRAYDLMLIILVAAFTVLIGAVVFQRRQTRISSTGDKPQQRSRFQFDLKTGLGAFILLGCFVALLAQANRANIWADDTSTNLWAVGRCAAIGLTIAFWGVSLLVFKKLKFRYWLLWSAALIGSLVGVSWDLFVATKASQALTLIRSTEFNPFVLSQKATQLQSAMGWLVLLLVHAALVTLIVWLFGNRSRKKEPKHWLGKGKIAFGGSFFLVLVLSIAYYYQLLLPPADFVPLRKPIAGKPNRFADLLKAESSLSGLGVNDFVPVRPGLKLSQKLAGYEKTFADVEDILTNGNCFGIDWDAKKFDFNDSSPNLRTVARALSLRSLQSLSDGRHDEAMKDGLLCLKLADRVSLDGTMVHAMFGTAWEKIGVEAIVPGVDTASIPQLRKISKHLDSNVALYGSIDVELKQIIAADRCFMWDSTISYWLDHVALSFLDQSGVFDSIEEMLVRRNVLRELLRTEIAIRLYRFENETYPESLEALVPNFLSNVPLDRFSPTGQLPFVYHASEDGQSYQLYSFGKDRDDDGGQTGDHFWEEDGDIDLKVFFADRLGNNEEEVKEYETEEARRLAEEAEWEKELEEMNEEDYDEFGEVFEDLPEEE